MFGPYTPTLLALLTKSGLLKLGQRGIRRRELQNAVAVVTGGASGIGAALARRSVRAGCRAVVVADNAWIKMGQDGQGDAEVEVDPDDHPIIHELQQLGAETLALRVDVGKKTELEAMLAQTLERFGPPQLLFNNAGVGMPGVLSADEESLERAFDINLWSVINGMRIFIPAMQSAAPKPCYIVNTASLAGLSEATGLYGVTKHAVVAATEAVASELVWQKSNVQVAALCPSYVASNVVASTARAALKVDPASSPNLDDASVASIERELAGLPRLIAAGATCAEVADLTFDGIESGRQYIYTNVGHTKAALADRFSQLKAGGLFSGFRRQMEDVVAGGLSGRRAMSSYAKVRVDDAAAQALCSAVGSDAVSFSEAVIKNHASLEQGYHGWNAPDAVVSVNSTEMAAEAVKCCNTYRIPLVPYGAGTSVEGHIDCVHGGVMLNLSSMDAVLQVNDADMDAHVQAGTTREALNAEIRHTGLFFPVDPGANASIGGMVATNASGTTTVRYGNMQQNVLGLTAVMSNGDIIHTGGRARKSSAGYDLTRLLIGSEGTLGVVTEARVRLHPQPDGISAAVCRFDTLENAVEASCAILCASTPARMELLDELTMSALDGYQNQKFAVAPTIFFEFHGHPATVEAEVEQLSAIIPDYGGFGLETATLPEERSALWKARHDAFWAIKAKWPNTDLIATDVCVPVSRLAEIIAATVDDIEELGIIAAPLFGHVGDGNFHLLVLFDSTSEHQVSNVRELERRLIVRAIDMEGTCTGEHGIGTGKIQYLEQEFGRGAVHVMQNIKRTFDPHGILNPGKVVPVEF